MKPHQQAFKRELIIAPDRFITIKKKIINRS